VQEDDIVVVAPAPLADQGDQACESFAGIDGIEWQRLELACKPDRFDGGVVRDAVGRAGMARDDFHACFVERNIKQIGRFSRKRHDIGAHPRGLGVDINADDSRVWHCHGRTSDETGLRAGAAGAVHDGGWCKTQSRGLWFDLGNRRGIGDGAQRIRDSVGHKVRLVTLRLEIADERANGGIAVTGPRHVMELRAEQPVEKRVARGLVFRRRRFERPW
jgi:hypothetical protein